MSTPTNQPAVQQLSKMEVMKSLINNDSVQAQFQNALKENSSSFIASLIDLYSGDTYLQNCSPKEVIQQALKAAVLRLPVIKALGQAYIIPYKKGNDFLPQFQIGYKGYIQLAIRTGAYRILNADVVFEGEYRTANKLTGEFDLSGTAKSDKVIGFFAHFELTTGFSKTLFMTREKVDAHAKKYSKSYNQAFSPWKTEFDKMGIKTVLTLLLTHWGFMSTEMQQAFSGDQDLAEQVQEEIKNNANQRKTDFSGVEEIKEDLQEDAAASNHVDFSTNPDF